MNYKDIKKKLPDAPGVYFFRGSKKKVVYIGKATSLRDRVRSYFTSDIVKTRGPLIAQMLEESRSVDFQTTDSVLEALLCEASLIKKYSPRYNTEGKDDKSFNYIVITDEDFPRVLLIREKNLFLKPKTYKLKAQYGPFPHGSKLKEALKIIRKIFPFRDSCKPQNKPCFNRQIGLCPGVCTGEISKKEYARTVRHLKLFFEGKKKKLVVVLKKEMEAYAKKQEFEKAQGTKKTIFALKHIQDVALLKQSVVIGTQQQAMRIEGYDVAHLGGTSAVGVMVVLESGNIKKSDYRKFKINTKERRNDIASLEEILLRRLAHNEWQLPRLIVVDGGVAQKNIAHKVLREHGFRIPVVGVVKDEHHRPREILGDKKYKLKYEREILLVNSEAHRFALSYHKKLRTKSLRG